MTEPERIAQALDDDVLMAVLAHNDGFAFLRMLQDAFPPQEPV